jgi:UPF0042 nucleotide-binding protein
VTSVASKSKKPFLVIVTGLSGAGNSTALNALADNGMYCIDNLPIEMLEPTIDLLESGRIVAPNGLALCMDVRDQSFAKEFPGLKRRIADRVKLDVIFLTADEQVIATRYGTTRRKHPLLRGGETLVEAIAEERALLGPVEESADHVYDTSTWSPHQLARAMEDRFSKALPARVLHVTVTSFGFKYGQHKPADMLFDVRFLDNPHFVPELKELTGMDAPVRDYVFGNDTAKTMFAKIDDMLRFLLPQYYREGKHYLRIGIGCSGGKHRSVAFAEEIGKVLLSKPVPNTIVTIIHRDVEQET